MAEFGSPPAPSARPLRIALFSGNYNYVVDGPVKALNRLVARIEANGDAALVFAPTARTPAFRHAGELVSVPSIALPGGRGEYRLGLGLNREARQRLDAFAPTLVHVAAPDWLGLSALNYARDRGVPAVASFHTRFDTYPRYYGMRWLEPHITSYMRYFYKRCTRVYAPSPSMVDELARDGIGRDVRLWARGVDHLQFNPQRRDEAWRLSQGFANDNVVIGFVGRIVREKGLDIFAAAVRSAQAADASVKALVVGDGPERNYFEEILPGAVFTGHLDGDALARAYASADVFFNPSVTETFGNVTLEAMASGVPAVCAAASGSRSLVDDGATGFLVDDAKSAPKFAAALLRLAADPALRRRMGEAAREKSAAFQWDAILNRLLADYREIVSVGVS
ncbi:MAG: glycosyl transferase family 1 [Alphaproteobacteria bacterium RIFCSPHIGHO2_12_FULL_63_12]|nr:MAG: glycosyl transferase family 1 [Alphaproteobacteria bacterium RIFCSPHIGHO2_12_FULL_63_12]